MRRLLTLILAFVPAFAFAQEGGTAGSKPHYPSATGHRNTPWAKEMLFADGRPWCDVRAMGALGNGVTDDTAAIQACVNLVINKWGAGVVYFPPSAGSYCTFTGITNTSAVLGDIHFFGGGMRAGALDVCGHNVTALTIGKQFGSVSNMAIYGYGMHATDNPFGASNLPALYLTSGASYVTVSQVLIQGGSFPIKVECSGCHINQTTVQYGYGDGAGTGRDANAYIDNSGQYWFQTSFDQVLPGATPTYGTTIGSWTASHAYTAGTIVNIACGGLAWWYQATVGGTSGSGSSPACTIYGVPLIDGTVTWQLIGSATHRAVQVDTGANEVYFEDCDMTGFFNEAFVMSNTLGGSNPTQVGLHNSTPGGSYIANIFLQFGTNFRMDGGDISNCTVSGCAGADLAATFTGFAEFNGVFFKNGLGYGIFSNSGPTSLTVVGNFFQSAVTAAVYISSNTFTIGIGNNCAGSAVGLTGTGLGAGSYFPAGAGTINPSC